MEAQASSESSLKDFNPSSWYYFSEEWWFYPPSQLYYHTPTNQYYFYNEHMQFLPYNAKCNALQTSEPLPPSRSIKIVKSCAKFMQGRRNKHEDRHVTLNSLQELCKDQNQLQTLYTFGYHSGSFYALFDGHCGSLASTFCSSVLPKQICQCIVDQIHTSYSSLSSQSNESKVIVETNQDDFKDPKDSNITNITSQKPENIVDNSSRVTKDCCSQRVEKSQCKQTPMTQTLEDQEGAQFKDECTHKISKESDSNCSNSVNNESLMIKTTCTKPSTNGVSDESTDDLYSTKLLTKRKMASNEFISHSSNDPSIKPISNASSDNSSIIQSAITEAFQKTDQEFLTKYRLAKDGSTAVMLLLLNEQIYVAWIGDSRAISIQIENGIHVRANIFSFFMHAIVFMCKTYTRLTEDHKPNREDERRRIEKSDFKDRAKRIKIDMCRQGGSSTSTPILLAVSRSFGDQEFKKANLIITDPEIHSFPFNDKIKYFVLACDGIWDVLSEKEITDILTNASDIDAGTSAIVKAAYDKGSQDNLTAITLQVEIGEWVGTNVSTSCPSSNFPP